MPFVGKIIYKLCQIVYVAFNRGTTWTAGEYTFRDAYWRGGAVLTSALSAVGKDIAEAAYYFVCHARNTTGAELVVDGGNMIQLYPIIK